MRKGFLALCLALFTAISVSAQVKAKYVFYFIGDGMGVNQVNAAETYLGAMQGRIGIEPLSASHPSLMLPSSTRRARPTV